MRTEPSATRTSNAITMPQSRRLTEQRAERSRMTDRSATCQDAESHRSQP